MNIETSVLLKSIRSLIDSKPEGLSETSIELGNQFIHSVEEDYTTKIVKLRNAIQVVLDKFNQLDTILLVGLMENGCEYIGGKGHCDLLVVFVKISDKIQPSVSFPLYAHNNKDIIDYDLKRLITFSDSINIEFVKYNFGIMVNKISRLIEEELENSEYKEHTDDEDEWNDYPDEDEWDEDDSDTEELQDSKLAIGSVENNSDSQSMSSEPENPSQLEKDNSSSSTDKKMVNTAYIRVQLKEKTQLGIEKARAKEIDDLKYRMTALTSVFHRYIKLLSEGDLDVSYSKEKAKLDDAFGKTNTSEENDKNRSAIDLLNLAYMVKLQDRIDDPFGRKFEVSKVDATITNEGFKKPENRDVYMAIFFNNVGFMKHAILRADDDVLGFIHALLTYADKRGLISTARTLADLSANANAVFDFFVMKNMVKSIAFGSEDSIETRVNQDNWVFENPISKWLMGVLNYTVIPLAEDEMSPVRSEKIQSLEDMDLGVVVPDSVIRQTENIYKYVLSEKDKYAKKGHVFSISVHALNTPLKLVVDTEVRTLLAIFSGCAYLFRFNDENRSTGNVRYDFNQLTNFTKLLYSLNKSVG